MASAESKVPTEATSDPVELSASVAEGVPTGPTGPKSIDGLLDDGPWTEGEWSFVVMVVLGLLALPFVHSAPRRLVRGLAWPFRKAPPPKIPPGSQPQHQVRGREDDLRRLRTRLAAGRRVALVPGDPARRGGLGKSTLARHYADRYKGLYAGVCLVVADSSEQIVAGLAVGGAPGAELRSEHAIRRPRPCLPRAPVRQRSAVAPDLRQCRAPRRPRGLVAGQRDHQRDSDQPPPRRAAGALSNAARRTPGQALHYAIASLRMMKQRGLPPEHRDVGTGYNNLAARLADLGRHRWAERFSAEAVRIAKANTAIPDADRAVWLNNHGQQLQMRAVHSKGAERAALFARARGRYHAALGIGRMARRRSREVAAVLDNLAGPHEAQGRRGAAAVLHRTALRMRRDVLPAGDTHIAESLNNLGATLLERGEVDEARPLLAEGLAIMAKAFSGNPRHRHRVNTALWLAAAHLFAGDWAAAEAVVAEYPDDLSMAMVEAVTERIRREWAAAVAEGADAPGLHRPQS